MKKLTTFWYVFKRSLTDPVYYTDILKSTFGFSLKYLLFLLFLVLAVKGLVFSVSLAAEYPKIPQFVSKAKTVVTEFYPKDLVLTINNGSLRTNVDEPYTISFPKSLNVKDGAFAVIDTKSSVEDYKKFNTLLLVTKNAIAYPDSNSSGGFKVQPLSDFKGYAVINRQTYDRLIGKLLPYFNYVPALVVCMAVISLIFFPLIGSLFYLASILFYLLILTLLTYVIAKMLKKNLDYKQLYHLSLHGITFSIIFDLLKSFFGISIPFTFIMPYLIWMVIVLNTLKITYGTDAPPVRSAQ